MSAPANLIRTVLQAGLLAPSAENKHYLAFQIVDAETVDLFSTDTPTWDEQKHRKLLAMVAYGAVVENMSLKAGQLGHELDVDWLPSSSSPELMANIRLRPSLAEADPLAAWLAKRHTNRRFFDRKPASATSLKHLSMAADGVDGARLVWMDSPSLRRTALKAIRLAETERFKRRKLHAEMFTSIRFESGWKSTLDEWLPPSTLEVEPPMRGGFASLRHWPLMRLASLTGAHHGLGFRSGYLPAAMAPHLGVIAVAASGSDQDAFAAGRALQRVWIAAAAEGLEFQVYAAPVALSRQAPGNGWVSPATRAQLNHWLKELMPAPDLVPFMFFRLGHAKPPTHVTGRKPLDHYLR
ncbi:MAG: hypothetical protein JWQ11_3654 [Rhizobacter sp.]|nr:hypothetical protein [Rhizobacter sp.]